MVNASSISCDFDSNILRLLIKPSLVLSFCPALFPCSFHSTLLLHHFTSCVPLASLFFFIIRFFFAPCSLPLPIRPSLAAGGEDGEARERDEIRHDRRKERQHDRNISRAAPDKRCWTHTLNAPHVNSTTLSL